MNKDKSILSREQQLLKSRHQQLDSPIVGALRSHGKLWGMDVFSWFKPSMAELENTLNSFPSAICWYANEAEVLSLLNFDDTALRNVSMICTYDKAGLTLPNEQIDHLNILLGAAKIEDALDLMRSLKQNHRILLFTSSSENWMEHQNNFEAFLNVQQ